MKIRITTLPPHGLPVEFELEQALLNSRLREGRGTDISFTIDPVVQLQITPITEAVTVQGDVLTRVLQPCASCGKPHEREMIVPIDWMLKAALGHEGEEDDIGLYYYNGDHFDLEEPIAEACILQLSPYWRPEVTGDGPCTGCQTKPQDVEPLQKLAEDRTKTRSLAAALEKARTKNRAT